MMKMTKKLFITFVFFSSLLVSIPALQAQDQNNFEISKNIEIYVDVLRQLNLKYADDIQPGDLSKTAIDAMLGKLDPYTVYIPESQLEDFELMTKGEYGGIGALIQKQDEYVVITEPYEGFPAQKGGLKAGDKIIKIDGDDAVGKSSSDISEKLKGTPGTEITITVQPYGDTIQRDVTINREKVKFPNVPYYGMVSEEIAFISLFQFNQNSAAEVKKAFNELREQNDVKGLILDLRDNGGGLLNEAVDIVNMFVPKNTTVVTTKGKSRDSYYEHKTRYGAIDTKIPIVVLVNKNSASASEIVAGAIQDFDRGIVIGVRTFGKGLVQNVVSLPYNSKIKMTVAKYYIPSGRCIQAIDYFDSNNNGRPDKVPDSLISAFKTKGGRTVYDGGGISPDVKITVETFSQITGDLFAQNYIFNFANEFALLHDSIPGPTAYQVSDEVYDDFKQFVTDQDFDYETETESLIERLRGSAEREGYLAAIQPVIDSLEQSVREEKLRDLDTHRDEIEQFVRLEIISRYYYQQGKLISTLKTDKDILKAKEVLTNKSLYDSILDGSYADDDREDEQQ
jgi:carboxyl-terminal processing protease